MVAMSRSISALVAWWTCFLRSSTTLHGGVVGAFSLVGRVGRRTSTTVSPVAFASASSSSDAATTTTTTNHAASDDDDDDNEKNNNVLILDHLNVNHEKGRHDLLRAFYFEYLGLAVDPRKEENLGKGRKTLWANAGCHQFHLPEGDPDAQVFDGVVTLAYEKTLEPLAPGRWEERLSPASRAALENSAFDVRVDPDDPSALRATDPWGGALRLVADVDGRWVDDRGTQPGVVVDPSSTTPRPVGVADLTVHAPRAANLAGVARFYEEVLGAVVVSRDDDRVVASTSPNGRQTLTFVRVDRDDVRHEDLRPNDDDDGHDFPVNAGAHVSLYVADLRTTYRRAAAVGATYVNPRFKRRAYTEEEAVDQCMFRCLDVVDPRDPNREPILRLEHEVRSVVTRDGTMYKSCPFFEIPDGCVV